jgi:hypothetical protein
LSASDRLWRIALRTTLTAGWLYGRVARRVRFRRRRRTVELGPLCFRVPATWGAFEPAPEGDFVLRSVPTEHMIWGDAVWYANVAEIRVRPPAGRMELPPEASPMDEMRRELRTEHGPVLVLLRVARGMAPARRREAERVLAGVRARRGGVALRFPEATYGQPAAPDGGPPPHLKRTIEGGTVGR